MRGEARAPLDFRGSRKQGQRSNVQLIMLLTLGDSGFSGITGGINRSAAARPKRAWLWILPPAHKGVSSPGAAAWPAAFRLSPVSLRAG